MKHILEEKRIKQLFHELRQEDERHAPSFTSVLQAASSKARQAGPALFSLRVAVAAAMLILVGGLVFILLMPSLPPAESENSESSPPTVKLPYRQTQPPAPQIQPAPTLEAHQRKRPSLVRHKRSAARSRQPAMLISEWQSPTDFLLRTPGEQLLKTVPRVGESLIDFKPIIRDEKN
jgi:hypothetical protein